MMKQTLIAGLLSALFATSAAAFDPFTVKDIRVEGLQRTEAGTVFGYLPVKVGDTMTDEKAAQAVKALFATGFFKDVRIEIDRDVLVLVIEERPAIASVEFVGLKAFDKETVKKSLKDVGLAESRIFDRALVERAEQELKRQYISQGYYAAQIKTTITPLERNRVGINFAIDEGNIAKIKQINIVGASVFKEKDLLDLFVLRTPGLLTWYTKNDQYSKQKLSGDMETLRSFYLDRGYLEFNIESTQVAISEDKQDIYITINISEGEKYTVSAIKLAGELLLPEDELRKLVTVIPGDTYSRQKLTDTTKAISERLGNEGYAFSNVNAAPEIDKEKRQAAFTIYVDPGRRVYVRRIDVVGNSRTRDEVVRREMRQMESAWYDGEKINKSRTRVDRLGYFDEVTVETPAVAGTTDQVDVVMKVKEKPTGSFMLGAGFSSSEKLVLSGSVQQANLFGSGKTIGVGLNTSKVNTTYSFSYTDPYYTVDGISRGFDVYHRKVDLSSLSTTVGTYGYNSMGGGVRYGFPIAEDDSINFGVSMDSTKLEVNSSSPQRYQDYVTQYGNTISNLLLNAGWAKETIDSRIYPTKGAITKINGEVAPGGNAQYYRVNVQRQQYFPLSQDFTLLLNGEIGLANGIGGKPLPFFKNFYAGGVSSVRGYDTSSLGPRDAATNGALGGNKRLVGNAEFIFPMPGVGKDKSMRLAGFVDAGQVWGTDQKVSMSDLRYSAGLAAYWTSPMGPLKFSLAKALNSKSDDKLQTFQFQMGSTF